ncbi:MAG: VWA domain-containing protein [Planctomycetaceae bacterium]
MTLLNSIALFAASALIVPVVVHLRKRCKSSVVDWPAMQFLTKSLASRRKGLKLEEFLLLLLRCLIVILFVMAMARPVIPTGQSLRWSLVAISLTAAIVSLAAGFTVTRTKSRKALAFGSAALFMILAALFMKPRAVSLEGWGSDRDVAIVIDGSSTMADSPHFSQAIQKATQLARQLSGESTVSILLAGPIHQTIEGSPFRDLRSAEEKLRELQPTHGGNDLGQALELAKAAVSKGKNSRKQIVVFTDNQLQTWESVADAAPVAAGLPQGHTATQGQTTTQDDKTNAAASTVAKTNESSIHFAAHVAQLPDDVGNISVHSITVKSPFPTINRPIPCEVEVTNHGSKTVRDVPLTLLVDGKPVASEIIPQLEQGATKTFRFTPAMSTAGSRVIEAKVDFKDFVPDDNVAASVISVVSHIRILLLNGNTFGNKAEQSATFAQLALDPQSLQRADQTESPKEAAALESRPIQIRSMDVNDLPDAQELAEFPIVLLCDVPRLNSEASDRLTDYVKYGGCLWMIPQDSADADFYNDWKFTAESTNQSVPFLPCQLLEHATHASLPEQGTNDLSIASESSSLLWLKELFERGEHDLFELKVSSYWKLKPLETSVVPLKLSSDEPLFAERTVGRGRVLLQAIPLTADSSNLISRASFPVLMHLWTQSLATGQSPVLNISPTASATIELAKATDESSTESTPANATLVFPASSAVGDSPSEPPGNQRTETRPVAVTWVQGTALVDVGPVISPGVYHVLEPDSPEPLQSFSVVRDTRESDLAIASEAKLNELAAVPGFQWFQEIDELTSPGITTDGGREIWKFLAFAVLWLLAAESLLIRWIRNRRSVTSSPQPNSPTGFTPVEVGLFTTRTDTIHSAVVQKTVDHRDQPGGGVGKKPRSLVSSLNSQGDIS